MARGDEMEDEDLEVPKEGGSKKKLIIIVAAAVLVLAIGGGAAYYFLYYAKNEHAAEEGADKKVEKKVAVPVIYALEPFIVNITDGQHETRYLKIKIEFDTTVGKETVKAEFEPYLAAIRDSILILLTSKTLQDVQDIQGKNRLREEIMAATNKILPPGKITRLYFTDFVVQ